MAKPQTFVISVRNPAAAPSPWLDDTHRLLAAYKADFERQCGKGTSERTGDSAILMASDFLHEAYGTHADWELLQVLDLFDRFSDLVAVVGFREATVHALGAFYCYLGKIGRVSPTMHQRMRQLSLDCVLMGLDRALEQHRIDLLAHAETAPARPIAAARRALH